MRHLELASLAVVVGLILGACSFVHDTTPTSYFEAKEKYARALDRHVGGENPNFRIAAIKGPIYKPGQILAPESAEPVTEACLFDAGIIRTNPWVPLPKTEAEHTFTFGAQVPGIISSIFNELADIGANIKSTSTANFTFSDVKQETVNRDVFKQAIKTVDCINAIAGEKVTVVRGLVHAKEKVSSTTEFTGGIEVKALKNDAINLSYDSKGSYAVEDKEPLPRFFILVNLEPLVVPGLIKNMSAGERLAVIRDFVREEASLSLRESRPSNAVIAKLGGIVPQ